MANLLDSLLSKQDDLQKAVSSVHQDKRPRLDIGATTFPTLLGIFGDLHQQVNARSIDISKLEVEVRIGMVVSNHSKRWRGIVDQDNVLIVDDVVRRASNLSFKAGFDEVMFDKLKRILSMEGFKPEILQPQRQRSNLNHDRWEIDPNGNTIINLENKAKLLRCDIALLSHHYDIRIDAAVESPQTQSNENKVRLNTSNWELERFKRRTTYQLPNKGSGQESYWKLDVTEVETTFKDSTNVQHEIELEFEMNARPCQRWLTQPIQNAAQITHELASQLYHLIQLCIPSSRDHNNSSVAVSTTGPRDIPLPSHVPDSQSIDYISKLNSRIREKAADRGSSVDDMRASSAGVGPFVGSMPMNMSRRNLQDIQRSRYFLTEKSDGVRNLLYVVPDNSGTLQVWHPRFGHLVKIISALLMDRAKHFQKLHGSSLIGGALRAGTVLDGELVFNLSTQSTIFLIFDIICLDGVTQVETNFEQRYRVIEDVINPRIKSINAGDKPFTRIFSKAFFPKENIGSLLSRISWERGHRIYRDRAALEHRNHKTDGIIFQPNSPYKISTDNRLLKWKWPELCTVDLQVGPLNENGVLSLLASGPDGVRIDCTSRGKENVGLGAFDGLRLAADFEEFGRSSCIAEVAYNPDIGLWSYFQIRKDKTDPNYINTVLGVLMEQAEAVSIEELEYRLLARNEQENDYSVQLSNMKRKALEFQRQRTSAPKKQIVHHAAPSSQTLPNPPTTTPAGR